MFELFARLLRFKKKRHELKKYRSFLQKYYITLNDITLERLEHSLNLGLTIYVGQPNFFRQYCKIKNRKQARKEQQKRINLPETLELKEPQDKIEILKAKIIKKLRHLKTLRKYMRRRQEKVKALLKEYMQLVREEKIPSPFLKIIKEWIKKKAAKKKEENGEPKTDFSKIFTKKNAMVETTVIAPTGFSPRSKLYRMTVERFPKMVNLITEIYNMIITQRPLKYNTTFFSQRLQRYRIWKAMVATDSTLLAYRYNKKQDHFSKITNKRRLTGMRKVRWLFRFLYPYTYYGRKSPYGDFFPNGDCYDLSGVEYLKIEQGVETKFYKKDIWRAQGTFLKFFNLLERSSFMRAFFDDTKPIEIAFNDTFNDINNPNPCMMDCPKFFDENLMKNTLDKHKKEEAYDQIMKTLINLTKKGDDESKRDLFNTLLSSLPDSLPDKDPHTGKEYQNKYERGLFNNEFVTYHSDMPPEISDKLNKIRDTLESKEITDIIRMEKKKAEKELLLEAERDAAARFKVAKNSVLSSVLIKKFILRVVHRTFLPKWYSNTPLNAQKTLYTTLLFGYYYSFIKTAKVLKFLIRYAKIAENLTRKRMFFFSMLISQTLLHLYTFVRNKDLGKRIITLVNRFFLKIILFKYLLFDQMAYHMENPKSKTRYNLFKILATLIGLHIKKVAPALAVSDKLSCVNFYGTYSLHMNAQFVAYYSYTKLTQDFQPHQFLPPLIKELQSLPSVLGYKIIILVD